MTEKRFIALIKPSAIRDAQICLKDATLADPLDDSAWEAAHDIEVYVGLFKGNEVSATKEAAEFARTDIANIRLIPVA